jgi:hypothetical protein
LLKFDVLLKIAMFYKCVLRSYKEDDKITNPHRQAMILEDDKLTK